MDASVIIPTYNRSDALASSLASLANIDYPSNDWEAIVVDDGSSEDIQSVVGQSTASTNAPFRCIRQENRGPAAARNRGASEAKGNALIFIDNDIIVDRRFISSHMRTLNVHAPCWVVGRIVHPKEIRATAFGRFRDRSWEGFHESSNGTGVSETKGMTAANLSIPAEDFRRLGGFDESFTIASSEDWELGMRARQSGIRIVYDPSIVVVHNDWAVTLERFCERQKLYSISDVLLWRKYGSASPRERLVLENSPVNWSRDPAKLILKKAAKRMLAGETGGRLLRAACHFTERFAPDTPLNRRAYDLAIGASIFAGVREGLTRYRA